MRYPDRLYGEWKLPRIVERIIHTKEMARSRNIAQSNIPNILSPYGPIPSRFQHGMGVCFLANQAIRANAHMLSEREQALLLVSALLHDTGNPPFSHLSEPFLWDVHKKNGESFLENILDGSETEKILKEYDISVKQVLAMIMGQDKPFSDILHGSMDIDNLDNIPRFLNALNIDRVSHFEHIASAFRLLDNVWCLPASMMQGAYLWQKKRLHTYQQVYSTLYANIMTMLSRAVELAFVNGCIRDRDDFYFLNDTQALEYLKKHGGEDTNFLLDCLFRWEWYFEILAYEWANSSAPVTHRMFSWRYRYYLASAISVSTGIPEEKICIFLEKGKEARDVAIPFVAGGGSFVNYKNLDTVPLTRLRVYVHEDFATPAVRTKIKEVIDEALL